ncbi:MAG TPA: sigma-70 family RNA polymerase sigma factor [Gemmatimonadales bacterium]|nr:sigma-70 family RNA polymerase sigma factor [Gemmatimonadales bacterium]
MPQPDPTTLLTEWRNGNHAALDELFSLVYEDLRRRAHHCLRGQAAGHTLTTTDLVHETYLKLIAVERVRWEDRAHFMALSATAMRHVLLNYARRNSTAKRGGGEVKLNLDEAPILSDTGADQILALDEALERLAALNARLSRTVELRFFGGLTVEETAEALGVAPSTVKLDWQKAKAWLFRELRSADRVG